MLHKVLATWLDAGWLLLPLALLSVLIWWLFLQLHHQLKRAADQEALVSARRNLLLLRACTAAAPLVGLLGTVMGMTTTFDAMSGNSGLGFAGMAGGIGSALVTTQFGLIAALPGIFASVHITRRCRRLHMRLEVGS